MSEEPEHDEDDEKEGFCGLCTILPMALAGTGATMFGSHKKGSYQKTKKIMLWGGVVTILISIFVAIYFLFIKQCDDCR